MKLLKVISIICMAIAIICMLNGVVLGAIIANRTIDNSWVFKLDDSTGTLTIHVRNADSEGGLQNSKNTEGYGTNPSDTKYWRSVWKMGPNDSEPGKDIRPYVKHIKFIDNTQGAKFDFNGYATAYMFYGFDNLEDIDFEGVKQDTEIGNSMKAMFQGCSKLKEIDLSKFATKENSLQNMQDLFNGCSSLEKVTLNNSKFIIRRDQDGDTSKGSAQIGRMFQGCSNLKEIDMSNITLYGRDNNWAQLLNGQDRRKVFNSTDLPAIETIKMDNIKLINFKDLNNLFSGLTTLKTFSMKSNNPGDIAPDVEYMTAMFKDCISLEKLDISGLGKLPNILNMDDLIAGCSGLETLNINNLDNTHIGPTNKRHELTATDINSEEYVSPNDYQIVGAVEFGREIFGKNAEGKTIENIKSAFPKLKKIEAKNSDVWFCKNSRGVAGSEYYIAASESDIMYLSKAKKINFISDSDKSIVIESIRDWVDIIIDRESDNKHTVNGGNSLPDANTNKNNQFNLNTNGAGRLAPGIYTFTSDDLVKEKLEIKNTYYRIAYIGRSDCEVTGVSEDDPDLILKATENFYWINTKTKTDWPTEGNYVIDRTNSPIKIKYIDAAIDAEGNRHDVIITINKITFKNLENIPTHNGNEREHDGNRYIDYHPTSKDNENNQSQWITQNIGYYRTILQATKEDGLTFRNYVKVGEGNITPGTSNDWQVLSGGSGTDIDFTVEIEGASDDETFLFHAQDLDVPAKQIWDRPSADACYDNLLIENAIYGLEGESFVLGTGNKSDKVILADHTGLVVSGNTVISTGSDPDTPWSEFIVESNAGGANYTWKTGIACTTYALRNTDLPKNKLRIIKVWEDLGDNRPDDLDITIDNYSGNTPAWEKNGNEWTMTFIDEDNTSNPGYKVTEIVPQSYEALIGTSEFTYNNELGCFEATLENKEKTVDITVEKKWVDTDEQKDKRPEKIKIVLLDGNTQVKIYELDTATENSYTFTDLPMYDKNGDEIAYNVKEEEVNDGDLKFYTRKTVFDEITNKWTITNTFTNRPEDKIEIEVTKKWVDTEKQRHRRPDNIRLVLKNGNDVVQEYNLKTKEETSYIFKDLAKYDKNGNEIKYTVDEEEVNVGDLRFYSKSIDGFQITNTYKEIPTKIIVKYIDQETGEALSEKIVIEGEVEDEYSTKSKTFQGYALVKIEGKTSGQMAEEVQEVTYYYVRIHEESPIVNEVKEKIENPKTGDNIMLWITIMVVSGLGFRVTSKGFKRAKRVRH